MFPEERSHPGRDGERPLLGRGGARFVGRALSSAVAGRMAAAATGSGFYRSGSSSPLKLLLLHFPFSNLNSATVIPFEPPLKCSYRRSSWNQTLNPSSSVHSMCWLNVPIWHFLRTLEKIPAQAVTSPAFSALKRGSLNRPPRETLYCIWSVRPWTQKHPWMSRSSCLRLSFSRMVSGWSMRFWISVCIFLSFHCRFRRSLMLRATVTN